MIAIDEDNYKEAIEASFKVFAPRGISSDLQQIINESHAELSSTSSDFWVMVTSLKEFIANEGGGEAPLEGSIPDMTSSTEHYVNLQKIYQAKAEADCLAIEQRVRNNLKKLGREPESISKATIKSFCRNARKLKVCRYRLLEDEFSNPSVPELQKYLTDEDYSVAVGFYILLRAVDRFAANYNHFPGEFDGPMDEDISRLKTTAVGVLNDLGCNGSTLTDDLINEMCRFGAAELHAVAAFIGGVASQEVIKVFFFHGRFICGPDPRGLLLTTTSISLSSWIFAMYIGDDLPNHSSLIVTISVFLTVIVLVNLILVSATDPGIISRNDDQVSILEVGTSNGIRSKRVMVNGVEMKLKYCRICKIFRPPRSCHCAVCDNCVEKFDHHCPWIGQCVALRNYRYYLTFVISALVLFVYLVAFSVLRIHHRMAKGSSGLLGVLKDCPETVALVSFSFSAIWFLASLAIFHIYLIAVNQTAYENFRQRYADSQNPYDRGMISNFKEVLLLPLPPPKVDFRAEVVPRRV